MSVELNSKITKIGNSYWVLIPKALIDCKVLEAGKKITLKVDEGSSASDPTILIHSNNRLNSFGVGV